jgi:hypothetical protein
MSEYISVLDVTRTEVIGKLFLVGRFSSEGVYKPKRVGRRTDRYKRYFGARTPPGSGYHFIAFLLQGRWSATPPEKEFRYENTVFQRKSK